MNNDELFNTHLEIYESTLRLELVEAITSQDFNFDELFNIHLEIFESRNNTK